MLTKKQKRAIELLFDDELSQKQISEKLGIHEVTLSRWKSNEDFIAAREEYIRWQLKESSSQAMKTMKNLLHARSEMVRFNAAKDLMDRAGFAPVEQHEIAADLKNLVTINDDIGDHDG